MALTRFGLCVPTLDAGEFAGQFIEGLAKQSVAPARRLVIDSGSTDQTPRLFSDAGFEVHRIPRDQFDHGGTRQLGLELLDDVQVCVFMTQDARLANGEALERLVGRFQDPEVGAVFGRQLPRPGADLLEQHARLFNYPGQSYTMDLALARERGAKALFFSNAFAAYRRTAMSDVGGFPRPLAFGEDQVAAGLLLRSGWKTVYAADAEVYHSHAYSPWEEMKRYFEAGNVRGQFPWMGQEFGEYSGEGLRFVRSELSFLARNNPFRIPGALGRTALKYVGYQLGKRGQKLPAWLAGLLSYTHSRRS